MRIRNASWAAMGLLGLAMAVGAMKEASAQSATRFNPITVILSKTVAQPDEVLEGSTLSDPAQIFDETFIYLDLRVIVDALNAEGAVASLSDLSPTGTIQTGFCGPGAYGKLDMSADLAYMVDITTVDGVAVASHIYPGERAENPYNDVFCGFDGKPDEAQFRLRGFYFVMRDRTDQGVFVQLRPVNPTPEEAQVFWTEQRDRDGQ